jgi:glutamate dehydrogenase (NAD(P)+)
MSAQDLLPHEIETEESHDPYLDASLKLEQAARFLDLEHWIVQRLRHAEREVTVNLPVTHDNGQAVTITGLRVQHNCSRGPTLGSVRFCPKAHLGQMRALAMANTWKAALLDLPFGGSAGALVCNPEELSERELRVLSKQYVTALRGFIGPHKDVLSPGRGANERTMAWMLDAYRQATGDLENSIVVGKPEALGGLSDRRAIFAQSILVLLREVLSERHQDLETRRIAIQGFGCMGAGIARLLHDSGASVVAVADISGGLLDAQGINIPALQAYSEDRGMIYGFANAEAVCNAEVLEADCDILILAAAERQVTAANAPKLRAPLVVEAARSAISSRADEVLQAKNTTVIPDLLGTAGAMIAYSMEWNINVVGQSAAESALRQRIGDAYKVVRSTARSNQLTLRDAAHIVAVGKVASAIRML